MLTDGGRLLLVLGTLPNMLQIPWVSRTSNKTVIAGPTEGRPEDVQFLAELADTRHYKPAIDRSDPFEHIAEAQRYVGDRHNPGNVTVTLEPGRKTSTEDTVQTSAPLE